MARRGPATRPSSLQALAGLLTFLAIFAFLFTFYLRGHGPLEKESLVLVAKGSGVSAIASSLAHQGAIRHPLLFRIGYYLYYFKKPLLAGEYLIPPAASPLLILRKLASGDVHERVITIPEGFAAVQVLELINQAEGLSGQPLTLIKEGSILPDTYQYIWGETRQEVLSRMQAAHESFIETLWQQRAEGLPFKTPEEAITLASIVEKETGVPEERPRIASVFLNRLQKHMPLQSDPTIIYAITEGKPLGRSLTRRDLEETKSPYNTYLHGGLPPGPIANPGKESLAAVLSPLFSDELYFVATGTGGHVFSTSLDEHNRNVRRYRLERQKQKAEQEAEAAAKGKPATP